MLDVVDISKSYKESPNVLLRVNLFVSEGMFVSIVGRSGSGKSTLLSIIGALDRPSSGHVLINGCSLASLNPAEAAFLRNELIGFVFQSFHLLPRMTAWENVALPLFHRGVGRSARKARALEMLDRVGLADRVCHRPEQLSGGQRQRVAIARALVGEPRLVLADEPTGNLDSGTGAQVMNLLRALNKDLGVTILMVTHDRAMARLCDKIIEISDGRILSPDEMAG